MNRYYIPVLLIFALLIKINVSASPQGKEFTQRQKDSIKRVVCLMEVKDQIVRDSLSKAEHRKDTVAINRWSAEIYITDKKNFHQLEEIIKTIGFPCPQLLGEGACYPFGVLIHWCKEYPAWFSSSENIALFQKEIELKHLPKCQMDLAYFCYVSYLPTDLKFYKVINSARAAYGLPPYSMRQYEKIDVINPMLSDKEKTVSRSSE